MTCWDERHISVKYVVIACLTLSGMYSFPKWDGWVIDLKHVPLIALWEKSDVELNFNARYLALQGEFRPEIKRFELN